MWRPERGHNRLIDKSGCCDRDPNLDPAAFVPGIKKSDVTCSAGRDPNAKTLWEFTICFTMRVENVCIVFLLGYRRLLNPYDLTSEMERDMSHLQSPKSQPRNGGFSRAITANSGELQGTTLCITPQSSSAPQAMVTPLCTRM